MLEPDSNVVCQSVNILFILVPEQEMSYEK